MRSRTILLQLLGCLLVCALPSAVHELGIRTVHSTNPDISYFPESACHRLIFGQCDRYDPWVLDTYESDGRMHSYYRTSSWGNDGSGDQSRMMQFTFMGVSLSVYGAPPSQLGRINFPGKQEACVGGQCTGIDVEMAYTQYNPKEFNRPVLLWSSNRLSIQNQWHHVTLRLTEPMTKSRNVKGISFHHLEYQMEQYPPPPKYQLDVGQKLRNNTVHSTSAQLALQPPYSIFNGKKYNPWQWNTYAGSDGRLATFLDASTWGNARVGNFNRRLSISFTGTAIYVYGAPRSQIENLHDRQGYGKQIICLDGKCEPVDVVQSYLNIPASSNSPVLLYHNERLHPSVTHHCTLKLVEGESPVPHIVKSATLSHVIFTEVVDVLPVVPGTRYHEEYVDGLTPHVAYTPECHGGIPWSGHCKSYNPWNIERYTTDLGGIRHFYRTSTWQNGLPGTFNNRQIQWSVRGETTSIEIWGAPRPYLVHPHGRQEVCISDFKCVALDVKEAYLNIESYEENQPVSILKINNIPTRVSSRTVSLRLTEKQDEPSYQQINGMTFSHAKTTWAESPVLVVPPWGDYSWVLRIFWVGFLGLFCFLVLLLCIGNILPAIVPHNYDRRPLLSPPSHSNPTLAPQFQSYRSTATYRTPIPPSHHPHNDPPPKYEVYGGVAVPDHAASLPRIRQLAAPPRSDNQRDCNLSPSVARSCTESQLRSGNNNTYNIDNLVDSRAIINPSFATCQERQESSQFATCAGVGNNSADHTRSSSNTQVSSPVFTTEMLCNRMRILQASIIRMEAEPNQRQHILADLYSRHDQLFAAIYPDTTEQTDAPASGSAGRSSNVDTTVLYQDQAASGSGSGKRKRRRGRGYR